MPARVQDVELGRGFASTKWVRSDTTFLCALMRGALRISMAVLTSRAEQCDEYEQESRLKNPNHYYPQCHWKDTLL